MERTVEAARAAGIGRGWDHANYVDAYGPDPVVKPGEDGAPGRVRPGWVRPGAQHRAYMAGWRLGVDRFKRGRYADGTRMGA